MLRREASTKCQGFHYYDYQRLLHTIKDPLPAARSLTTNRSAPAGGSVVGPTSAAVSDLEAGQCSDVEAAPTKMMVPYPTSG